MNLKQIPILVVVLAVLGAVGVILLKKDRASWQGGGSGAGEKLLGDLPVGEELAEFTITEGTNTLTLAKEEGMWIVRQRGNYPANYPEISRTVLKLRDLKAAQTEQVTEAQLGRLELLDPGAAEGGGTLIEFRDKADKPLASLLLGKQQTRKESRPSQFGGGEGEEMEVPVGRWVMDPAEKTRVALVSDPLSNLDAQPQAWLNKDFFKIQKIKTIAVTYPEQATNSFKLSRETESGTWSLAGIEDTMELDTSKTSGFNYALSSPNFDDVLVEVDETELGLTQPTTVSITTFEDFIYEIKAGRKQNDKYAMRVTVKGTYPREREAVPDEEESVKIQKDQEFADTLKTRDEKLAKEQSLEPWTYLVSSWTLDSVLKKRGDLVKEKEVKEEVAPDTTEQEPDLIEGLMEFPTSD